MSGSWLKCNLFVHLIWDIPYLFYFLKQLASHIGYAETWLPRLTCALIVHLYKNFTLHYFSKKKIKLSVWELSSVLIYLWSLSQISLSSCHNHKSSWLPGACNYVSMTVHLAKVLKLLLAIERHTLVFFLTHWS